MTRLEYLRSTYSAECNCTDCFLLRELDARDKVVEAARCFCGDHDTLEALREFDAREGQGDAE